jgi:hypothetical protein
VLKESKPLKLLCCTTYSFIKPASIRGFLFFNSIYIEIFFFDCITKQYIFGFERIVAALDLAHVGYLLADKGLNIENFKSFFIISAFITL